MCLVQSMHSIVSVKTWFQSVIHHSESAPTSLAEMIFLKSPINGEQEGKKISDSELSFASN